MPARYVLKADALSFLWREYRLTAEYRLFRWAPPFIASVERHRWDGLTFILSGSYYRRLPTRGGIGRIGVRYYVWRPAYSPQGFWVGLHGAGQAWGLRGEKPSFAFAPGLTLGYQHIFRQAYGGIVEPHLLLEPRIFRLAPFAIFQFGLNVGFAARHWERRNLP
ncbi:MAG: hypothetical protein NZZ60_03330 [Bacteroidia bacterium]|nr:hypothetical protein [Bacteroidia bacterium]MCX7652536.1 hypothetical protein [Bacteroidia bacterium]MDW8417519.1 hypothetical protein [Bacteroidia bacterium]